MATHEVDQKLLGRLAKKTSASHPQVAGALFQILGLSVMLGPRLVEARQSRRTSVDGDTQSLILLHQILWLSRTGREILKNYVEPAFTKRRRPDILVEIMAAKLKGSFEHIFCLFRNDPPIIKLLQKPSPPRNQTSRQGGVPLSATSGNGRVRGQRGYNTSNGQENTTFQDTGSRQKDGNLRDPIPSMLSETSYITNPYSNLSPPPGLPPLAPLPTTPNFLLSTKDYRRTTARSFQHAAELGKAHLYASHPMVLSIAMEQCAFLWDCMHEHETSRRLARSTIRDLRRDSTPMDDEEFADASLLVGTLGRMMRRKSSEGTPRFGFATPPAPQGFDAQQSISQSVPPVPVVAPTSRDERPPHRDEKSQRRKSPPQTPAAAQPSAATSSQRPTTSPRNPATTPQTNEASSQRSTPNKPLPPLPPEAMDQGSTNLSRNTEISRSIQRTPDEFRIPRRPVGQSSGSSRDQERGHGHSSSGHRRREHGTGHHSLSSRREHGHSSHTHRRSSERLNPQQDSPQTSTANRQSPERSTTHRRSTEGSPTYRRSPERTSVKRPSSPGASPSGSSPRRKHRSSRGNGGDSPRKSLKR